MPLAIILIGVYAVVVFVGGVMGFLKAGSKPSLIAGTVSAALLAVAFWMGQGTGNAVNGLWMAAGIAVLLAVVFLIRFLKTRGFMPSGMMLILSLAAAGYFAYTAHGPL
jgi:uncharacterized membrane protein (UPF0136 family)